MTPTKIKIDDVFYFSSGEVIKVQQKAIAESRRQAFAEAAEICEKRTTKRYATELYGLAKATTAKELADTFRKLAQEALNL